MRSVRIEVIREEDKMPLVLRSRMEQTFFGMGLFVAALLLAGGVYLLEDAIRAPLEASAVAVVVAGLVLALGAFVIVYLLWPRSHLSLGRRKELERFDDEWKNYVLTAYSESMQSRLDTRKILKDNRNLPGPM